MNPGFIQQLSPLITLSVGAAVTNVLENNVMERLAWLEVVFANIDPRVSHGLPFVFITSNHESMHQINIRDTNLNHEQDAEIREVAPRIIPVLGSRLESQYMRIAEASPRDLSLRRIPPLARSARELMAVAEQ